MLSFKQSVINNFVKKPKLPFGCKRLVWLILYFLPLILIIFCITKTNFPKISWLTVLEKSDYHDFQDKEKRPSWLSASGRFIVDEEGKPVILRGVNLASVSWGYHDWFPKAVEVAAKDWGVNVIRTRVYQDDYFNDPENFFRLIEETIIGPAREYNIYVILNPWIGNNDSLPNEQTIIFWQEIARHYQSDPTIIYDILAEPHDIGRTQVWEANQKLIGAIRQVHPKSLIMVTGVGWGREINSYLNNPLPYENIVYRTNPYNKAGEFEAIFGQIARFYPVFIGEFGADGYPPMSRESVSELLSLADQFSLGWTAWNFHSVGCPCLLADYQTYQPSVYGQIVKSALELPLTIGQDELEPKYTPDKKLIIYSDHLENNFRDLSWDAEVDLVNQEQSSSGQKSIKVKINKGWGALYLASYLPIETENVSWLKFNIKTKNPNIYRINLVKDNNNQSNEVNLSSFAKNILGDWYQVALPTSVLINKNEKAIGLNVKDASGQPSIFWIDNIYLE
ncbi:MAG: glycoside hydrolase family 5 protein [Candidatus Shapirobacteria bacterium]|nr:glycoside hydrolase family 5 protein [Candidatus Shapirobacteria bacterium]